MPGEERQESLFTCSDCGSIRIDRDPNCECVEWDRVESVSAEIREPDLDVILRDIFGMSPLGLEVCLCLMNTGKASVAEVTDVVDADRSTVARHMDHLVDIGVVEPDERVRPEGGRVTVFQTAPPPVVRDRFRRALYHWMVAAIGVVDSLTGEKVERLAEVWSERDSDTETRPGDRSAQVYYRS